MSRVLLACMLAFALVGDAAAQPASRGPATDNTIVLRPGDAVRVTVWRREDLSGEFNVAADGTIVHPILRQVVVAGVPFAEAESRVEQLLRSFEGEVQYTVEPLVRIGVGGEVRQPNLYLVPPDMSVAFAVARAGGATDRGRLDRVDLIRGGITQQLDLLDPTGSAADLYVRSGDQVLVSRRVDIWREYIAPAASIAAALATIVRMSQ